jgi:hypothetical protein
MNLSPIRAALHLFFLAFVAALFIFGCRSFSIFGDIDLLCEKINSECGEITITQNGIRPAIAPEKNRFFYSANTVLRYFPDNKIDLKSMTEDIQPVGVVWTPGIVVLTFRTQEEKYSVVPIIYPTDLVMLSISRFISDLQRMSMMTPAQISDYVKQRGLPEGPFNVNFETMSVMKLKPMIYFYTAVILCGAFLLQILLQALLFIGIYSIIFSFIGGGRLKKLKLKQMFVIGTYTAFPAIFIASFFPALELPFLDYQDVFLFAFLIYLVVVFNRVQRFLLSVEENRNQVG